MYNFKKKAKDGVFIISIPMQRGQFGNFFQVILCTRKDSVLKLPALTFGMGEKFKNQIFPDAEDNLKKVSKLSSQHMNTYNKVILQVSGWGWVDRV